VRHPCPAKTVVGMEKGFWHWIADKILTAENCFKFSSSTGLPVISEKPVIYLFKGKKMVFNPPVVVGSQNKYFQKFPRCVCRNSRGVPIKNVRESFWKDYLKVFEVMQY
jgi:hypothetical protein